MPVRLDVAVDGDTIYVRGDLSGPDTIKLRAALKEAARRDTATLVDLSGVTYIDATGIRELVAARRRHHVRVVNPSAPVTVLFHTTGGAQLFDDQ